MDAEQRRKTWFVWLSNELDKIEPKMPVKFVLPDAHMPAWTAKVEQEVSIAMLPAAKLRHANYQITARRMGSLIGHGCAMAVWMHEWFGAQVEQASAASQPALTKVEIKAAKHFNRRFFMWYQAMCRLAKRSLASCVDQSYEDMRDFLVGYADGFARKPSTLKTGEFGSTAFDIYLFMLLRWRQIEAMGTLPELHRALIGAYNAHHVGDLKRLEKICQRVGKTFRKPGRPPNK